MDIRPKLDDIERTYEDLNKKMSDPEVFNDQQRYRELSRTHSEIAEVVNKYREYRKIEEELKDARSMLKEEQESEMEEYLKGEAEEAEGKLARLEEELREMLLPKDALDDKNVIVEIRAGTGGEEAGLFAGELYRMYTRFAESRRWKVGSLSSSPSDLGGFKEIIFEVKGKGAYSRLKYESGVHRVQRIPVTESGGRIHTSAATVAVLPEAEDVEVDINPNDIKVDVYRSTGPGGQSVNTTDSAVRVTHVPTGMVVSCQDEKSQLQNKEKAMRILRARMLKAEQEKQARERAEARSSMVGSGDRSERIRTYNYPQGRVTDHRIGLTLYRLDTILEGDIEEIIEALAAHDRAERLKQMATSET